MCVYANICNSTNMQKICNIEKSRLNMLKYAIKNMHQMYAEICSKKYAIICNNMHIQ